MALTLKIVHHFFLHDTPPHDNTPPYHVWLKMVGQFKRYRPDKLGHTDGKTGRRNDSNIPPPPPILAFIQGGGDIKIYISHCISRPFWLLSREIWILKSGCSNKQKKSHPCSFKEFLGRLLQTCTAHWNAGEQRWATQSLQGMHT